MPKPIQQPPIQQPPMFSSNFSQQQGRGPALPAPCLPSLPNFMNSFSQPTIQPQIPTFPQFPQMQLNTTQQLSQTLTITDQLQLKFPQLNLQTIQQYQTVCQKIQQIIPQQEQKQLLIIQNLASMQPNQIVLLQEFYSFLYNVELKQDIQRIDDKYMKRCIQMQLMDQRELLLQQLVESFQKNSIFDLVNCIFSLPEQQLRETLIEYQTRFNRPFENDLEVMFKQQLLYQRLIYNYCMVVQGKLPYQLIQNEDQVAYDILSDMKAQQSLQFVDRLSTIHRQSYWKIALKIEATTKVSFGAILSQTFTDIDAYVFFLFNEHMIDSSMGIAFILNELIRKEDGQRIAVVSCISRPQQIEKVFFKYGRLFDKLRGHPYLMSLLQVKGQ
ncbi:Conserved_hypothetical protein [Hexamita inflata]|uniref:Uncharacterized protein n=1 Tax=Hexamita inflata TaxID=28002 RepID=A0AA86RFM0_9EUKA|nr:Conserved hypothetical protein [Hexamita inflata]